MSVSPAVLSSAVLRRYHEVTFGGAPAGAAAFEGTTFEEYVALRRIRSPDITARNAALTSPVEAHRGCAGSGTEPPAVAPRRDAPNNLFVARKSTVDLATELAGHVEAPARRLDALVLERIKDVRGWSFLAQLGRLEQLHVAVCGTSDLQCASPSLDVGDLRITQCDAQCLKMLVQSTRARRVAIIEPAGVVFDCHQLAPHVDAASLTILAPLLRNLNVVCHKQRETLSVAHVEPDERLTAALSVCCQLRVLDLTATRPFGPALLPTLPGLERLVVPGYPEHRKAWVDFAVNNPRLSCFFASVPETGGGAAVVAVEEVHHGIDILRVNRRGRVQFAIEADVAGLLGLSCSNGDLEERLRSAARRARQTGLKWNSEADTLVVSAAAPASLRWVVDAARAAR